MKFAILAAGEGSRLAAEGIKEPKPMVTLQGEPMLNRLIRIFESCGAETIAIITNNLSLQTQKHVLQLQAKGHPVHLVVQTTPSSMHSFHALMPLLGEGRFILTTVDTIFNEDEFHRFIQAFSNADASLDGMMAVTDFIDDERPLWVSTMADLTISGFHDTQASFQASKAGDECRYISGGIYGLDSRCFATLDRCIQEGQQRMRNFQRALVADGFHLTAYPFSKILDVDHVSDITKAEAFLSNTKPLKIIGIQRDASASPNRETADAAIFEAVAKRLEAAGAIVTRLTDEQFLNAFPDDNPTYDPSMDALVTHANGIFTMSRNLQTCVMLDIVERCYHIPCVNSGSGITTCSDRQQIYNRFHQTALRQPPTWFGSLYKERWPNDPVDAYELLDTLPYPIWIKRSLEHSQTPDDIIFASNEAEAHKALDAFVCRKIDEVAFSAHVQGDLIKFYGVAGEGFFEWRYATEAPDKFGLDNTSVTPHHYPFNAKALQEQCETVATCIGVPVYGGDAIIEADGQCTLLDFNDWPSFSCCREAAAEAIAHYMLMISRK